MGVQAGRRWGWWSHAPLAEHQTPTAFCSVAQMYFVFSNDSGKYSQILRVLLGGRFLVCEVNCAYVSANHQTILCWVARNGNKGAEPFSSASCPSTDIEEQHRGRETKLKWWGAVVWIHKNKIHRNRDCTYKTNGIAPCCWIGVLTEDPLDAYVSLVWWKEL